MGADKHKEFRSSVESLSCLLKHSRPELSNAIGELTRHMSGPGEEMHRAIKWVTDNPNMGWKCEPEIEFDDNDNHIWKMSGISNTTWGSNRDDGRSVTRHMLCFLGAPIA